jgi:arginyl-tRNA synthetase
MAQREGLISLRQTSWHTSSAFWLAVSPNPIPWLNSGQQLCLEHPAERALIVQLLALLDELYCPRSSHQPINWHKAALDLSQTFQTFYSGCQIWGEVKNQNISLSQARLGLVLITQSVLRLLLQDRLGVVALQEL